MRINADSRCAALIESTANMIVGLFFSVVVGLWIYPLFGWQANVAEVTGLTVIFTALSVGRSYLMRRVFVWLKSKGVLA